jgi:hypothetical protein
VLAYTAPLVFLAAIHAAEATKGSAYFKVAGSGRKQTESFELPGGKCRVVATVWSDEFGEDNNNFARIKLENEAGWRHGRGSLQMSGRGRQTSSTVVRRLEPGTYFLDIICGVEWEIVVEPVD